MNKTLKIRTTFIFLAFCLLYCIIIFNLYLIQIRQNTFFSDLGKQQYNITISRYPVRAEIFDKSGKQPLALNKDYLSAFITPKQLAEPEKVKAFLKNFFPNALKRLQKTNNKNFMFVQRRLQKQQIDLIDQHNLSDIKLLKERGRFYPVPSAGPIVGITDIDNKGLTGIELYCNKQLGGVPAVFSLKKDARSGYFYFGKETKQQKVAGKPVRLTIDSDLQFLAHEELQETIKKWEAKEGSVIIIDPKSGNILAMVNVPSFDPNNYAQFNQQTAKNKTVTEIYEFGSIAKVFTALAALQEGVVDINEHIDCQGSKTGYVDGRKVNTLIAGGVISFSEVIEKSNNIGIAIIAKRIGEKLFDHYKKMGFGKKTGIEFPGEQSGYINPPSNWSKQSIISLSYGYEMSCTLLQIAKTFCMIARDGYPVQPNLMVQDIQKNAKQKEAQRLYSKEVIDVIKQILENTTLKGTSHRAGIKGYRVMSKTGTANLLVDGKYSPKNNIYTCAGIIEKGNYQRVIVTFIKEASKKNAYASTVAAPLFEKIAKKTLIHDKIV